MSAHSWAAAEPRVLVADNDNEPQIVGIRTTNEHEKSLVYSDGSTRPARGMFRHTEDRDGFAEDGIVPVDTYGLPSSPLGKIFPEPRRGDFIQTFTGGQFWPLDPRADEIDIRDIAHALAMQCRYAGHCIRFYSVAEHSVLVARWLLPRYGAAIALAGLLHDASEAYLVDVPRPIKPALEGYKRIENQVYAVIAQRFNLPREIPAEVHEADSRILLDERAQNMAPASYEGGWPDMEPPGIKLQFWAPDVADIYFLSEFKYLSGIVDRMQKVAA